MQSQWCLLFSYVFDSSPEGNYSSVSKHSAVHYANQLDANCVWCKAEGFLNLFLAKKTKTKKQQLPAATENCAIESDESQPKQSQNCTSKL